MVKFFAFCLSSPGVFWLSKDQWVRRTRTGHEEVNCFLSLTTRHVLKEESLWPTKKKPQKNKNNRNSFRNISTSHHLNKHLIDVLSDFFNFSLKFEVEVLPHLKSSELNDWMEKQKVQKRYLCSPLYSCHHTSHPVVVRVQIQSILKGGGDLKVLKPQDNCCYKL